MPINFHSITKGDIINEAYSQMRISGLTIDPSPSDIALAVNRLEIFAQELATRSMDGGYRFSEYPDVNDEAGIKPAYIQAYSSNLAIRLIPDFNKQVPASLISTAQVSASVLASDTARIRETPYPSRMPIGSGNTSRMIKWGRYYPSSADVPDNAKLMRVGEINNYIINFSDYLDPPEFIESFTINSTDELVISNQSIDGEVIKFTAMAKKTTYDESYVTAEITTSDGRVNKRTLPFFVGK